MRYRVLALDLDGTLTNSEKKVTEVTRRALSRAADEGMTIVLASGRPVLGIRPLAEDLGLGNMGGYIIAYNGGEILSCRSWSPVMRKVIDRRHYGTICALAREYGLTALTYDESGVMAENIDDPYVIKEGYNNSIPLRRVECLERAVQWDAVKFMIVGEPDPVSRALAPISAAFEDELDVYLSEPYFMEVVPKGVEKSNALSILLERLGCDRSSLVAIGDGLNDLPMMSYAGLSIAMGNAYDQVRSRADLVTRSNDEDGVAYAIDNFVLV